MSGSSGPSGEPVRIAMLGCGTVGQGVIRLLRENGKYLASRVGAPLEITRVLVRDAAKARGEGCDPAWVTTDPEVALGDERTDLVVEVMGGEEPANSYIQRALGDGKGVVTANKLLLARRGPELVQRAVQNGVDLAFEASVGGGIPLIRTLREALTSDWVTSVHALLNGTCNYVLTRVRDEGLSVDEVVRQAQELGYAESDPTLDVGGHDAAQKLAVMSMLAFGARVDESEFNVEGILGLDQTDFAFAERFGFTIKHLAIGHDYGDRISLAVHPAMISKTSVLANIDGVLNGALIRGRALGPCLLVGRGAGDMPTAVSVVADMVDVARSRMGGASGLATRGIQLARRPLVPASEIECRYYLRFDVSDEPGVLATVAGALGRHGVSIEQMIQEGRAPSQDEPVAVIIVAHRSCEGPVRTALAEVATEPFMRAEPRLIRIEDV